MDNNNNLVDLISEKNFNIRKLKEDKWNNQYSIQITDTEWSILSLIYGKEPAPAISEISGHINITRQATHKCIKSLNSKGLILIEKMENNNRNKCLELTPLGKTIFSENQKLKKDIEKEIELNIGSDKFIQLKDILKRSWG
ncbi:MAG TPA: winged helix-turn-helix transcriptional regulator [Clostridiales bacterium]|nr:winged helix-turn-helix transcriptional regulator [Clostridiales bacterium]